MVWAMAKRRNAVSYVRVSGLGQRSGDGPERQRQAIDAYCRKTKLDLVREFADLGVSGTTAGADRPGMTELIASIGTLDVQVVVVERADRLARDLVEGEILLRALTALEVQVVDSTGVDLTVTSNPTAALVRQLLGAVAEFDRATTTAKLRAARDRVRARNGRCEGVRPFGELAGEAEALAALRKLARKHPGRDRCTLAEIAEQANAAGIPTRGGQPWTRGTVHHALRPR